MHALLLTQFKLFVCLLSSNCWLYLNVFVFSGIQWAVALLMIPYGLREVAGVCLCKDATSKPPMEYKTDCPSWCIQHMVV